MEQHVANAVAFSIFPEWTVPTDAFISIGIERFDWRCIGSHDPDVNHIAGLTIQTRPDEAGRYGNDGGVVNQAGAFIEHDAVVVAPRSFRTDDVKFFSQLGDLPVELFQFSAYFFLRRYFPRLLSA